jgi:hypothetical protein
MFAPKGTKFATKSPKAPDDESNQRFSNIYHTKRSSTE